jgi:hypothetical protein
MKKKQEASLPDVLPDVVETFNTPEKVVSQY